MFSRKQRQGALGRLPSRIGKFDPAPLDYLAGVLAPTISLKQGLTFELDLRTSGENGHALRTGGHWSPH